MAAIRKQRIKAHSTAPTKDEKKEKSTTIDLTVDDEEPVSGTVNNGDNCAHYWQNGCYTVGNSSIW